MFTYCLNNPVNMVDPSGKTAAMPNTKRFANQVKKALGVAVAAFDALFAKHESPASVSGEAVVGASTTAGLYPFLYTETGWYQSQLLLSSNPKDGRPARSFTLTGTMNGRSYYRSGNNLYMGESFFISIYTEDYYKVGITANTINDAGAISTNGIEGSILTASPYFTNSTTTPGLSLGTSTTVYTNVAIEGGAIGLGVLAGKGIVAGAWWLIEEAANAFA